MEREEDVFLFERRGKEGSKLFFKKKRESET